MSCDTPVFACLLDASKAFDMIDHSLLFQKLVDHNTPAVIVRFLMYWYSAQSCRVSWNGSLSWLFSVSNGVRQGGVLSPVLFTIYVDCLLKDLRNLGVGCHWEGTFVGAMCYADDNILLAPCPSALHIMLKVCESFALSHSIKFNASKTQLIRFSSSPSINCPVIVFCNELLTFSNVVCHLGHYLSFNL